MIDRILCFIVGHHDPQRYPLGGFRCRKCGHPGADLHDMGYLGEGYVTPLRRVFSRDRQELTRTTAWAPSRFGW